MLGQTVDEFTVFTHAVKLSSSKIAITPSKLGMGMSASTGP
jgi:hypothetical protein